MKVFVSSTCYDLVDLRDELHEELRQIGVDARFSDLKDSDFVVSAAAGENSIETCLANVRDSDLVVVILSQRYGPPLGGRYLDRSATRCEYDEARRAGKQILFYVRDRLEADYSVWRKNGKPADFKAAWAPTQRDAAGLFAFLDEHSRLHPPEGESEANNWYTAFSTSVDLRTDVRARLKQPAQRATARRMIERGDVPLVIATGMAVDSKTRDAKVVVRYHIGYLNVGPMVAFNMTVQLVFGAAHTTERSGNISVVLRAGETQRGENDPVRFDIDAEVNGKLLQAYRGFMPSLFCRIIFRYSTPAGFSIMEMSQVTLKEEKGILVPRGQPEHVGKDYEGPLAIIRGG